ncbi:MAG: DUF1588 domain-containing protein, partial [Planctomycetaceae bacterium]|nr:DUF1588 domain-containing protein [Planctomycetaceae bacterium]
RFPQFNDQLRTAMFEEPLHYFVDLVRYDRSLMELLSGTHTFVNPVLAAHYGIPVSDAATANEWLRYDDADAMGRGGLLGMSVFMTKNSPGLRTSPVKRGYWVVRRLLGEHIPAPPPNVPDLPADEAALGDRTLRELLAKHREHSACSGCHERFDSIGLAFEGYGPVGERRELDLGGRAIDNRADFPDGVSRSGLAGLRQYLLEQRNDEFLTNFCRKLVSYGLGRSLILSDELLVREMQSRLKGNDYRFSAAVETIVTSPQFLTKRGLPSDDR